MNHPADQKVLLFGQGFTAVHLVSSSFLGFSGFMGSANSGAVFHFPRHGLLVGTLTSTR
jgi:hypothetical protein